MRLHLIIDVTPQDEARPTASEAILEDLEAAIEWADLEVEGRVYDVKVVGSGRTAKDSIESMRLRRPR